MFEKMMNVPTGHQILCRAAKVGHFYRHRLYTFAEGLLWQPKFHREMKFFHFPPLQTGFNLF